MVLRKVYTEVGFFEDLDALPTELKKLIEKAQKSTETSYSPYSNFKVGAVVLLKNGIVATGSNQENGAFPSGLCAERVALFGVGATYPNEEIEAIAIAATRDFKSFLGCSPCGGCRQVMLEYEIIQKSPIKVLFQTEKGGFYLFNSVKDLLPFAFVL